MYKIPDFLTAFFGRENILQRDYRYQQETGARIHRVPLHGFYSGRAIFHIFKLFRKVRELKPDVVFVHGEDTLTGMLFIWLTRWLPYPLVLDCHMLEMASQNRFREYFRWFYRRFVTPLILKRNIPLIRVVDSDFVEKCLGIPLARTRYLSLGTDTDFFRPAPSDKNRLREELGLDPNAFVVLYAGKLDEHKGGIFFSEALHKRFEAPNNRPIEFMVIGNTVGEYGKKVEENLTVSENRIVRRPTQRYLDLAKFYQAADMAVFPKQCSMSFFEVQACGLPVLFEENEINYMRVAGDNAFTFESGSIESFRAKLLWLASQPSDNFQAYSSQAREYVLRNFDFVPIARQYSAVLIEAREDWSQRRNGTPLNPRMS
jgi:glycosyltransferase involved in cell wall biosynthesis